ncbi:MAG: tetratricopeptide repeat protein [Candidatus Omnitrophica bacterium]|nr:tetratricopeptide repeat protein [Candidatus Omnitrophota bacterium]
MRKLIIFLLLLIPFSVYSQVSQQLKEQAYSYREEGYRLQNMRDLEGALIYYQKAIQIYPYYYQAYNDLGVVFEEMGKNEEAKRMYEQALTINPQYLPPYTNLALLYEKLNNKEKAIFYWTKRLLLGKDKKDQWWYKGREHLVRLGIPPELKKEIFEGEISYLYQKLSYKREQERLKILEEVQLHYNLGIEAFNNQDYSRAEKELKMALSLNPPDKNLQMEISSYYQKVKEEKVKAKIRSHIQEALACIENNKFSLGAEKLKDALSVIFSIQE